MLKMCIVRIKGCKEAHFWTLSMGTLAFKCQKQSIRLNKHEPFASLLNQQLICFTMILNHKTDQRQHQS